MSRRATTPPPTHSRPQCHSEAGWASTLVMLREETEEVAVATDGCTGGLKRCMGGGF